MDARLGIVEDANLIVASRERLEYLSGLIASSLRRQTELDPTGRALPLLAATLCLM